MIPLLLGESKAPSAGGGDGGVTRKAGRGCKTEINRFDKEEKER